MTGQPAGVDIRDPRDAVVCEVIGQCPRGTPRRRGLGEVTGDEAGYPRPDRLVVVLVHAGVSDLGSRHRDDLPVIAGIGEYLLVSGHPGVEADLAGDRLVSPETEALESGPVLECEDRAGHKSAPI